jgi:hypothetical protein
MPEFSRPVSLGDFIVSLPEILAGETEHCGESGESEPLSSVLAGLTVPSMSVVEVMKVKESKKLPPDFPKGYMTVKQAAYNAKLSDSTMRRYIEVWEEDGGPIEIVRYGGPHNDRFLMLNGSDYAKWLARRNRLR